MLGGLAYQDPEHASIKNLDLKNLSQINSEIADTATDIFIYDTSKDSDGGAWRKRTQNTSWYNETLNTQYRGSRREFPAVAVIVADATTDKVTIYDGDDPDLPMWMVFSAANPRGILGWATTNYTTFKVAALNGILTSVSNDGGHLFKFVEDFVEIIYSSTNYPISSSRTIGGRNDPKVSSSGGGATRTYVAVTYAMNDVAMTVLPNAPIDIATGLPVPTIAVATNSGVSVIKDDKSVVDITASAGSNYNNADFISIASDGFLVFPQHGSGNNGEYSLMTRSIPSSDTTTQTNSGNATDKFIFNDPNSALDSLPHGLGVSQNGALRIPGTQFLNYPNGLAILDENPTSLSNAMVVYIKSNYNTGWMQGKVKCAYLSDSDDTDKTNGQTDPNRSVFNTALTVTGTITKSAVATGADLVAYSGFSNATNYMDNTSFSVNFGNPPIISMVFWQKITDISDYSYAVSFSAGSTIRGGISNGASSTGYAGEAYFNMGSETLYTGTPVNDGNWHCLVGTINGTDKRFYLDGNLVASDTINNHDMSGITRIHVGSYGTTHAYAHKGSLALLRVSNSVPSAEQVKKMYEDEKHLFQENVKCTLYGSSDDVKALAYDEVTNHLHVGTSAGRSDFQGLRRINNTTTAVTTAISAHDEFIIEQ